MCSYLSWHGCWIYWIRGYPNDFTDTFWGIRNWDFNIKILERGNSIHNRKGKGFGKVGVFYPPDRGFWESGKTDIWCLLLAISGDYDNGEKCERQHLTCEENMLCNMALLEAHSRKLPMVFAQLFCHCPHQQPEGWFPGEFSPNFLCNCLYKW